MIYKDKQDQKPGQAPWQEGLEETNPSTGESDIPSTEPAVFGTVAK